jgi:DNA repair protein RadC
MVQDPSELADRAAAAATRRPRHPGATTQAAGLADDRAAADELTELIRTLTGGRGSAPAMAERTVQILSAVGGLGGLARADVSTLVAAGLSRAAAARLVAAVELGRRSLLACGEGEVLASHEAVVRWARPRLAHLEHEEVWVLLLDGRHHLRTATRVAQGGLHACALTPADVLRPAIRGAASAVVLVHNHPSGDPSPSSEDVTMTRAVAAACDVVAVPLLDHVIVARDGASSLLDRGVLRGAR